MTPCSAAGIPQGPGIPEDRRLHAQQMNSEYGCNHVDRVRLNQLATTPPGCPVAGSRRRQNIASHLDLATAKVAQQYYPHVQYNQHYYSKNHLNLEDYYSHIHSAESQDYEENYYESYDNNYQEEDTIPFSKDNTYNDVCSLRRTRSLAVIREETYNDLQISSARNSRRSQLIPRAKLVNRSLTKDRHHHSKKHKRERNNKTGSADTQNSSVTRDTEEYYNNLKCLDSVKTHPSSWQNEKSDLDSINSDYFKNSQHQSGSFTENANAFQLLEIELHQESSSVLPETTTSNSEHSDSSTPRNYSKTCTESEECLLSEDTATLTKEGIEDDGPVISYDSVYLSSEESSGETIYRSTFTKKNTSSSEADLFKVIPLSGGSSIERLYTKINKSSNQSTKPKILSLTTKRGALDRLACISTSQLLKLDDIAVDTYTSTLIHNNQYCSLPDINIGRSLKASERIDAKLRSSYRQYQDSNNSEGSLTSNSTLKKTKRARQREFSETPPLTSISNTSITANCDAITTNDINEEDSSLIETENQHCEIVVTHNVLLRQDPHKIDNDVPVAKQTQVVESPSIKDDFLLSECTVNFPGQIRIVVTDSQNNIIEEDSIESTVEKVNKLPDDSNKLTLENCNELNNNEPDEVHSNSVAIGLIDIHQRHIQPQTETQQNNSTIASEYSDSTCSVPKGILKKNCHKGKAEIHFPPPPPSTASSSPITKTTFESVFKGTCIVNIPGYYSNEEQFKAGSSATSFKMSRPQIIQIIDSKRYQDDTSVRESNGNVEKEFMEKVDSARCYWSRIAQDEENNLTESVNLNKSQERNFVKSVEDEVDSAPIQTSQRNRFSPTNNGELRISESGLESFSPTVEIIELSGAKQATIVKAHDIDENDFDHVRYKVMKSNQFQKDILNRSKKEAQFDGLLQYLQDYSFQELLSNNNIVIIEPVRTKIEKPVEAAAKLEPLNCKITGGSGIDTKSNPTKHHFFYQPVRVNRELIEEELPNPDTVRNARKFFEEHGLKKQAAVAAIKSNTLDSSSAGKRRSLRYLTIDTSYGNAGIRKWDSASLSSGISSGDLSSPCECNEEHNRSNQHNHNRHTSQHHQHSHQFTERLRDGGEDDYNRGHEIYNSEENLCEEDDMCEGESYYVSEDILEKIRECGSTITYYGGRVVDNKSPELSPMTRAIMQEIHGKEASSYGDASKRTSMAEPSETAGTCQVCQPSQCPHDNDIEKRFRDSVQFKLVKSNSCSSRLELVGTEKNCQKLPAEYGTFNVNRTVSPNHNSEERVRELVNRLESGTINKCSTPRIIESKCIEKPYRKTDSSTKSAEPKNAITINNHHIGTKEYLGLVNIINNVTVNNHHGYLSQNTNADEKLSEHTNTAGNKISRNKNVDLAFNMCRAGQTSSSSSSANIRCPRTKTHSQNHSRTIESNSEPESQNTSKEHDTIVGCEINKTDKCQGKSLSENGTFKIASAQHNRDDHLAKSTNGKSVEETNGCRQIIMTSSSGQNDVYPSSGESTQIKLLGKHYVANDKRLIEQRKYDEIEFEEFEVYHPGISTDIVLRNNNDTADVKGEKISTTIVESFEERI